MTNKQCISFGNVPIAKRAWTLLFLAGLLLNLTSPLASCGMAATTASANKVERPAQVGTTFLCKMIGKDKRGEIVQASVLAMPDGRLMSTLWHGFETLDVFGAWSDTGEAILVPFDNLKNNVYIMTVTEQGPVDYAAPRQ